MPPQTPIASGRRRSGTPSLSSASESGMMPAPPTPWIARATMSCVGSVLSAAPTEASVNTAMPTRKTVRRPKRSPSATAIRMNEANASVYALTNHCSSSIEAPRSWRMTGSAFVMTRLSSVAMNIGRPVAIRTSAIGLRRPVGAGAVAVVAVMRDSRD